MATSRSEPSASAMSLPVQVQASSLPAPRASRKRSRSSGDLEESLDVFWSSLRQAPAEASTLYQASLRLRQLQEAVEKRLVTCSVDILTPHEAVEFIFSRRVRLVKIVRNDFSEDEDETNEDLPSQAPSNAQASAPRGATSVRGTLVEENGINGSVAVANPASRVQEPALAAPAVTTADGSVGAQKAELKDRKTLAALFQVGRADRCLVVCTALGLKGSVSRYSLEFRLTTATSASRPSAGSESAGTVADGSDGGKSRGIEILLRCVSSDKEANTVKWAAWEALKSRFASDLRPVADFARSVIVSGVFSELRRRFAAEESDSDDESAGLVTTISHCWMMAQAILPTSEGLLSARNPQHRPASVDAPAAAAGPRLSAEL
eukprot:TRINITY_DN70141_c0_g1_i1.p1 TRINITY_DN70141_c0_g1~~TRINITY_DN70141_c0_g1_i1.p1  ORF type:complete len:393 (-),score=56.90 TRINITY_DN70141_c0_g1_i1:43-1176(-)